MKRAFDLVVSVFLLLLLRFLVDSLAEQTIRIGHERIGVGQLFWAQFSIVRQLVDHVLHVAKLAHHLFHRRELFEQGLRVISNWGLLLRSQYV